MPTALSHYLEIIRDNLRLDPSNRREISDELETHIEDRLQELTESGLSEEEAIEKCLGLLGSAKSVARKIYEAHSQGTWRQALLASTPHLLFSLLFALNWWQHIGWLSGVLGLLLVAIVYGWWHGKPTWVFPWLGYSLLPVLVIGILLVYLPRGWSVFALPIYVTLALWWLGYILFQTIKRDWLFSSLMLLPIPIIVGWFLAVAPDGRVNEYSTQRIHDFAPWIALSFIILASTIAAFIRLRQRWLKIALLTISGLMTLTMIAYYTNGKLSLPAFLVLILAMWGVFLIPPALERWIKSNEQRTRIRHRAAITDHQGEQ